MRAQNESWLVLGLRVARRPSLRADSTREGASRATHQFVTKPADRRGLSRSFFFRPPSVSSLCSYILLCVLCMCWGGGGVGGARMVTGDDRP